MQDLKLIISRYIILNYYYYLFHVVFIWQISLFIQNFNPNVAILIKFGVMLQYVAFPEKSIMFMFIFSEIRLLHATIIISD